MTYLHPWQKFLSDRGDQVHSVDSVENVRLSCGLWKYSIFLNWRIDLINFYNPGIWNLLKRNFYIVFVFKQCIRMDYKHILGWIIVLCLGSGTLYGQYWNEKELDFHLAPTFSSLNSSSDYIDPNGINLGIKLGATVNFKIMDWMGVVGGFDFTLWSGGKLLYREGGNFLPNSDLSNPDLNKGDEPLPDNTDIRFTLNYFEIPAGLQFQFPIGRDLDVVARIPVLTLGIRNRARGRIEAGSLVFEKEKIGKDVSFFNLMWGMALGAEFERWNKDVSLMLFMNTGLTDVTRDKGKQVINTDGGGKQTIREDSKAALNQFGIQLAFKIQ